MASMQDPSAIGEDWNSPWQCPLCTFHNQGLSLTCELCVSTRPINAAPIQPAVPAAPLHHESITSPQPTWKCSTCTFENHGEIGVCEICSSAKDGVVQSSELPIAPSSSTSTSTSSFVDRVQSSVVRPPSPPAPVTPPPSTTVPPVVSPSVRSASSVAASPPPEDFPAVSAPSKVRASSSSSADPPPKALDKWAAVASKAGIDVPEPAPPTPQPSLSPPPKAQEAAVQADPACPLCCEEFTEQETGFLPCACKYQVCIFCWHKIRSDGEGLCPACRTVYPAEPFSFRGKAKAAAAPPVPPGKGKKNKKKQQQAAPVEPPASAASPPSPPPPPAREQESETQAAASDVAVQLTYGEGVKSASSGVLEEEEKEEVGPRVASKQSALLPRETAVSAPPPLKEQEVDSLAGAQPKEASAAVKDGAGGGAAAAKKKKKKKKGKANESASAASEPDPISTSQAAAEESGLATVGRDSVMEDVLAAVGVTLVTAKALKAEDYDTECIIDSTLQDFVSVGCSTKDGEKLVRWADQFR